MVNDASSETPRWLLQKPTGQKPRPGVSVEATELFAHAWSGFLERLEARPPATRRMLLQVLESWRPRVDGDPSTLFLGVHGSPAFEMLCWVAESAGLKPDGAETRAAADAMLVLYFAVRIQDDIVDDDADRLGAYLQQVLTAEAMADLAQIADADALAQVAGTLAAFSEAALLDARARLEPSGPTGVALSHQGHKYLPLSVPLLALSPPSMRNSIREVVIRAGEAFQLTNDLLGLKGDLARGLSSPALAELSLRPGEHGADDIGPAVRRAVSNGRWKALHDQVDEAYVRAWDAAGDLQAPRLRDLFGARMGALQQRQRVWAMKARFGARRIVLDVELTRECNLRCPNCFVFAQEPDLRPGHLPALSASVVHEVIEELSGYDGTLHLTGGEPLAWPGVWEAINHAAQLGIRRLTINTNSTLLDEDACAKLVDSGMHVTLLVSIDGPPGTQDRARGRGLEEVALAGIRQARAAGLKALPATILSNELAQWGIDRWYEWLSERLGPHPGLVLWPLFQQAVPTRPGVGVMLSTESTRLAARHVATLMLAGESVVVADYPVINPLLQRHGVPESELWQCEAGRNRLCVQADRTITPCHPFRHELARIEAGSVNGFITRVLALETSRRLGDRDHDGCRVCPERAVCGSCQAIVTSRGLPLFAHDGHCVDLVASAESSHRVPQPANN